MPARDRKSDRRSTAPSPPTIHPATALVIGAGNRFRRDDGVGPMVARRLRALLPSGVVVLETGGEAAELLEAWQGFERVIIVDAASSGGTPGALRRIDVAEESLCHLSPSASSHGLGVTEAVELARALGRLPSHLVVYAVEGEDFTTGEGLSRQVAAAVPHLLQQILAEVTTL